MLNSLCGGLFSAVWNSFYNSLVRNVSGVTVGAIILVMTVIIVLCVINALKKGDNDKPIKDWFAFWVGIVVLILLIVYVVLLSAQ